MNGQAQVIQRADLVAAPEILVDLREMLGVYGRVVPVSHSDLNASSERRMRDPAASCSGLRNSATVQSGGTTRIRWTFRATAAYRPTRTLGLERVRRRRFSLGFS